MNIFTLENISRSIYDELKSSNRFTLSEIEIVVNRISKVQNLFDDFDMSKNLIKSVMALMNRYADAQISSKYKNFNSSDAFVRKCIDDGIYK